MHRIHDSFVLFLIAALFSMIGLQVDAEEADDMKSITTDKTSAHYAGSPFQTYCGYSGDYPDGAIQFIVTCPQKVKSPDGHWNLVQTEATVNGEEEIYSVYIEDEEGWFLGDVPGLNDHMPFVIYWSPRPNWFAVSHHVGSFTDAPKVFEITRNGVVERDHFKRVAQNEAQRMFPCLADRKRTWVWASGDIISWSHDGRRLAWVFGTSLYACYPDGRVGPGDLDEIGHINPKWKHFLMISNVDTGAIEEGSIRVLDDAAMKDFHLPTDGPYADF